MQKLITDVANGERAQRDKGAVQSLFSVIPLKRLLACIPLHPILANTIFGIIFTCSRSPWTKKKIMAEQYIPKLYYDSTRLKQLLQDLFPGNFRMKV
jgi:hypothetical protein